MIDLDLFFEEKPVPEWFKTHAIFKDSGIKEVHKIFPTIGLHNFEVESNLESTNASTLIKNLTYGLNTYINNASYHFTHQVAYNNPNLSVKKRNEKYAPALTLVKQLGTQLSKFQPFVTQFSTKHALYLTADILDIDKKVFARQSEGLFKVYNKLAEFLRKHYNYTLQALDSIPAFKEFSSHNVNGKMKIVFSSDGLNGAWDILTMSMRGISSCQAWTGQYAKCTIGSLLDPFTGIIYLTSGSQTEHGSKMIRRCVVRFVVDSMIKRPCIFLEYMYPGEHIATMKAFKDAIRSKVGDRFPIIDQRNSSSARYYVPYSETTSLLVKHSNKEYVNMRGYHNQYGILPYRDTFMEYKIKEEKKLLPEQLELVKVNNLLKLSDMFAEHTNISDTYINLIKDTIATEVFSKIDAETCSDNVQYTRKACINYFSNKLKISKTLLDKIQSSMKENKDKSIFIPGVASTSSTIVTSATKRAKKVVLEKTKSAKPTKSKIVTEEIVAKTSDTISATVDSQIVPVISQIFKSTWESISSAALAKAKKKTKTKTGKRAAIR